MHQKRGSPKTESTSQPKLNSIKDDVDLDAVLNDISKDLQNFDGLDDIQRGCIQTDLNSAKVKAMTKAQRLRWKRQNRTLARKVAQFRQNVGERNTLLQAEDPKDRIVFEIDDLDGSLKRIGCFHSDVDFDVTAHRGQEYKDKR